MAKNKSVLSQLPGRPLRVRLASPRGFCAGVERAIRTVEDSLQHHGSPVYVRHEIVHNRHVVERLAAMGAIFIESLDEVVGDRPVIFSAHGAPKSAFAKAKTMHLETIDATCPLVSKVHNQVRRHVANGNHVLLIGHADHQEVVGTMGQVKGDAITLIETVADAMSIAPPEGNLAYATQTTLSLDDTADIIATLKQRFPSIKGPVREDICYATSNRQNAVKATAPGADLFLVVGSEASSNSVRLVETALAAGAKHSLLIENADALRPEMLDDVNVLAVSSGASVPEELVEALLAKIASLRTLSIETIETARETVSFNLPLKQAS